MKSQPAMAIKVKPHRILFIHHGSLFENYGGVEYYLDDVVSMAHELYQGQTRCVIPLSGAPKVARPYHAEFVNRPTNPLLRKLDNRFSVGLYRKASELIVKFRPTLLFNTHVSLGPLVYMLSRKFQIPFVTCVYGIEAWGNLWPQDEGALRKAQGIVSISYWTKNVLVKRGFDPNVITILHPKLQTRLQSVPSPETRNATGPFTLLTVSRLSASEQYKGHDHVLKALALLKKLDPAFAFKYWIQGDGDDKPRLQKMTQDLGLSEQVEFLGAVKDREEFEKTYRKVDLFVMPSQFGRWKGSWRGEGFGIVFLEAAAFGVPGLAYDCGGVTDIIRNNQNGVLVEPDNIEKLAQAIKELGSSRELRERLGKDAYRRVMSDFTDDAIRTEMITAFNEY